MIQSGKKPPTAGPCFTFSVDRECLLLFMLGSRGVLVATGDCGAAFLGKRSSRLGHAIVFGRHRLPLFSLISQTFRSLIEH